MRRVHLAVALASVLGLAPLVACQEQEEGSPPASTQAQWDLSGLEGETDVAAILAGLPEEVRVGLASGEQVERTLAVMDLEELPPGPRHVLLEHLWESETEDYVREDIIDQIVDAGGPTAVRFLERLARGPASLSFRDDALYLLTVEGFVAHVDVKVIGEILNDPKLPSDLSGDVIEILKKVGSPEALAVLRDATESHPDEEVRRMGALNLAAMKDSGSLPLLRRRLAEEESERVRIAIDNAIGKLQELEETRPS